THFVYARFSCGSTVAGHPSRQKVETLRTEGEGAFMWKVRRTEDEDGVVLSLSGRLQRENLNELRRVFASETASHNLILDLKDLRLVDDAVVAFLADFEASGVSMRNCPAYIREWIGAEQAATESVRE
ncbi:MAG: hypothetical protein WBF54_09935, partial [Terriglobales bacterium]